MSASQSKLTPQKLKFYEDNGYVVIEDLVPPEILSQIAQKILDMTQAVSEERGVPLPPSEVEKVEETSSAGGTATATAAAPVKAPLRKLNAIATTDPLFMQVIKSPEITEIAAKLAGNASRLMLYSDQVFLKPAFCGSEKPMHQDNSYFRVTPFTHGVTCWMAVDEATVENGCVNYVPGSHKLGLLKHKSLSKAHLTPDVDFPLGQEIPVPVKAGSCIFHHLLTLHNSKANKSPKSRRSWAIHYANRDATTAVKPWDEMIPVCGF